MVSIELQISFHYYNLMPFFFFCFPLGAGENLRGTLLAAVDTVIRPDGGVTKNDELAHQGRIAMERGLAKMKGQGGTDVNHDVDGTDHFYPPEYRAGPWTDGGQDHVGDDRLMHGKSAGPGAAAANAEPSEYQFYVHA